MVAVDGRVRDVDSSAHGYPLVPVIVRFNQYKPAVGGHADDDCDVSVIKYDNSTYFWAGVTRQIPSTVSPSPADAQEGFCKCHAPPPIVTLFIILVWNPLNDLNLKKLSF